MTDNYFQWPILKSGTYSGGSPGADRVVFSDNGIYCAYVPNGESMLTLITDFHSLALSPTPALLATTSCLAKAIKAVHFVVK